MTKKAPFLMQLTESNAGSDVEDMIMITSTEQSSIETAHLLLDFWKIRNQGPGHDLGLDDETSWNILLDLYVSYAKGRSVVSSDLAHSYFVPKSTLGRYVDFLEEKGLIYRSRDPHNRVRVLLSLSPKANNLLEEILDNMSERLSKFQKSDAHRVSD